MNSNKPEGAAFYGKCPGPFCGGEFAWLFNSDCDKNPWCEGCIDEAHDRAREAMDFMNEPISEEEIAEMDMEEQDMLNEGDVQPW